MPEHLSHEEIKQLIQVVRSWYAGELMAERRAAQPDPERLTALRDGLAQCTTDRDALEDAGPDQANEIGARYAARVRELDGR